MERWGRSDLMRECLRLHQREFAESTRQRHVLLFVCVRLFMFLCGGIRSSVCLVHTQGYGIEQNP